LVPSIRKDVLRHDLDGQCLVYDPRADRVHLLDATTACVMEVLNERPLDYTAVVAEVAARLAIVPEPGVIELAFQELRNAELVESANVQAESDGAISRRDVVRNLAAAGISAVLVPTIATLAASRAYAQGTVLGVGSACTADDQCLQGTGRCCGGLCRVAACNGNGSACGPGVVPPDTSNGRIVDCTCCSGFCQRSGNSANFSCQA
jgi:PqqD family protein of HPr-rel-A system